MPAQVSGEVYRDLNFTFPDTGEVTPKFIVVLGESIVDSEMVITVRTTSKRHSKSDIIGCHQSAFPCSYYYLGIVDGIFPEPTWLQFDYTPEYYYNDFSRLEFRGSLTADETAKILYCASYNENGKLYNYAIKSIVAQIDLFKRSGLIKP